MADDADNARIVNGTLYLQEVCMDESIAAVVHVTNGTTPDLEFCEKFNSFKCKVCIPFDMKHVSCSVIKLAEDRTT